MGEVESFSAVSLHWPAVPTGDDRCL